MGKTFRSGASMVIVAASLHEPLADCRDVNATACPSVPPDQLHIHDGKPEPLQAALRNAALALAAADGGAPTYRATTGITVTQV